MAFFTLDWYHAVDDNFDRDETVWPRYKRHLEELEGVLPAEVLALARLRGVDDGLMVKVRHDRARRVLSLTLRAGDLGMGYYDLVVTYEGAEIAPDDEQTLAWVARLTYSDGYHDADVAYHEVDRGADGQIEHHWLFHYGLRFVIRCERLRWVRLPRRDRRLPRRADRFPGGPATPFAGSVIAEIQRRFQARWAEQKEDQEE